MTTHDHAPHRLTKQATPPRRRRYQVLAAAILATCALSPARANTDTWIGPSGNWNTGSNWSLGTAPAHGDTAFLTQTDALDRTVTLSSSPSFLAGLTIDSTGAGHMSLTQYSNAAVVCAGDEFIGYSGYGEYDYFYGGTNSVTNDGNLYLGYNAGSTGKYNVWGRSTLSGTATIAGNQYVGYQGTGTVSLGYYGTVTSSNLFLAYAPGSLGTYTLSGTGAVANTGNAYVGGSAAATGGSATLTLLSGTFAASGSLKVWNTPGNLIRLGWGDGNTAGNATLSVGSLDLSGNPALFSWYGGTLAVTGSAGFDASVLGPSTELGAGYYPKILSVTNALTIPAGTGLTVSGGALSVGSLSIQPGGTVTLSAGTITTGAFDTAGDPSPFAWTAGTLSVTGPAGLDAAVLGPFCTVAAGQTLAITNALSISAGNSLTLGGGAITAGTFDTGGDPARFTWTAGTLSVTGPAGLNAAALGPSRTLAAGQTLSVTNTLSVPADTSLTLAGGALNVNALDFAGDPSHLAWNSGTLTITGSAPFDLSTFGPTLDLTNGRRLVVNNTAILPVGFTLNAASIFTSSGLIADTLLVDTTLTDAASAGVGFNTLKLGSAAGTTGSYSLSAPFLLVAGHSQYVGYAGSGSLSQSNSTTNSIPTSYSLILGNSAGSAGYYSLADPASLRVSGNEYLGLSGSATFVQTGGTHSLTSNPLYLAYKPGSSATYSLSGGTLSAPSIIVGGTSTASGGAATFSMTGGSLSTSSIKIWNDSSLFSLAGGTLQTPSIDTNGNPNRFSFTGGTLILNTGDPFTLSSVGNLNIGPTQTLSSRGSLSFPANTSLSISGGAVSVSGNEYVATSGTAAITHSAGTNTLVYSGTLYLGYNAATTGTYSLSGTGTLAVTSNEYVGYAGTGKFAQSGGANSLVNASLFLTYNPGSTASYALSGGTLSFFGTNGGPNSGLYVGYGGPATFTQSAGTLTFGGSNYLFLGYHANTSGTYSLSSSGIITSRTQYVGYYGRGTFVQSGGSNTITSGGLVLGNRSVASGSYSLSDTGFLSVSGSEIIGGSGTGSFTQSGGTNAVAGSLSISVAAGSKGTYSLSAGSASALNVFVAGSLSTPGGTGTLSITGGSLSTPGTLKIWNTPNTSVSLAGGTLSLASLDTSGNPSLFSWTAGTLSFTAAPPNISPTGPLGPSLTLSPNMTLRTTALPSLSAPASLDISGGSLVVAYTGPSPADQLRADLQAGLISSSAADADPQRRLAIGYTDLASTLTVLLTPLGDANLDGVVNADDYALLDRAYARALPDAHWTDGDFNYDGQITPDDYLLIDTTLGQTQGLSPSLLSQRESQFGEAYVSTLLSAVPEPSAFACLFATLPFLSRRRPNKPQSSS